MIDNTAVDDTKVIHESRIDDIDYNKCTSSKREDNRSVKYEQAEVIPFYPNNKKPDIAISTPQTIEEAKHQALELQRFIDEILTEGIDYGLVKGFSKPSLLKPGAEKLCGYLKLIPRVAIVNRIENYDKPFFAYESKVTLVDSATGIVKAEGVGISNTLENRYRKSEPYTMQNTILKMSKKRSLVDAVLNVTGLSSKFTQDIEDFCQSSNEDSNNSSAQKQTKQQYNELFNAIKVKQISEETFNELLADKFHADTWKTLNYEEMNLLIQSIKNIQ